MGNSMIAARLSVISALHNAVVERTDASAVEAYERWTDESAVMRGQLERKRVASRTAIKKVLGTDLGNADVATFTFAVEAYLALRAALVLDIAAIRLVDGKDHASFERVLGGDAAKSVGVPLGGDVTNAEWVGQIVSALDESVIAAEFETGRLAVSALFGGTLVDVLGADHQTLIPRQLRHATGAFYTPQWLARHTLTSVGFNDALAASSEVTVLDPTCGSGIFLITAAEEARRQVSAGELDPSAAVKFIVSGLRGYDIDPLAAIQAYANVGMCAMVVAQQAGLDRLPNAPQVFNRDSLDVESSQQVDLVVGNPPWVNWEYLPPHYRDKHELDWPQLGLFDLQGLERAWSKEDVSALFLAKSVDAHLRIGGTIGFLVPQSLVKAALNHRGFRKFKLREGTFDEEQYRVSSVDDFVAIRPFEGVSNRTIQIVAVKGECTTYPLPYRRWTEVDQDCKSAAFDKPLFGRLLEEVAEPSNPDETWSHWTTGIPEALETVRSLSGSCAYTARTGLFTGGANAVFHLDVIEDLGATVRVRNITERAKRQVDQVDGDVEKVFLYPFLRGRDVSQWASNSSISVLLPHTRETRMKPVAEAEMARLAPLTLEWFNHFREPLAERKGFATWEREFLKTGFYACQRVGEYTFSDWKVVWRYIASTFITAVIGPSLVDGLHGGKPQIPNEKLMSIACESPEEAYFVGGLLGSSPVISFVESRMVSTQIAPHLVKGLRLPKFDAADAAHQRLARVCREGHELTAMAGAVSEDLLASVDTSASNILSVSERGARSLRAGLMNSDPDDRLAVVE